MTAILTLVIYVIVFGLIFWLLWWLLSMLPLPEPFATVARVVLMAGAVLIVCYLLLGLLPGGGALHLPR